MSIDCKRSHAVFQRLESDLVKLSAKPSRDRVHRFRTGARRLEILLSGIAPGLDRNQKKLLKLIDRIRKRAGKVRDLDVQLAALRSLKVPREPRRKTQLVHHLIDARARQEKKLQKSLDRASVREVRKRLKRAARQFDPEVCRDPLTVATTFVNTLYHSDAPISQALLHQYRILSKRARYAAELSQFSPASARLIGEIRRLQDALGDWHDWFILTAAARQNLGGVPESPLVAELHNLTGAKYRHAVALLSRARQTRAASNPQISVAPADHAGASQARANSAA
jgi:CHAD domain-containing protein